MANESLASYVSRLADISFVNGNKLSEWCSHGPFMEEDLATSNMALDLMGHCRHLYQYAAKVEGKGRTEDDFVYKRMENEFRNFWICELPIGDFGYTMTKQMFLSAYYLNFYEQLSNSSDETLAGIAQKAVKEVRYHLRHTAKWVIRLGDGTEESHARVQESLDDLWTYTGEMFEMDALDQEMVSAGIGVDVTSFKAKWDETIANVLKEATLAQPEDGWMQTGGKKGMHTENLGFMLAELQYLPRAYPDAKW